MPKAAAITILHPTARIDADFANSRSPASVAVALERLAAETLDPAASAAFRRASRALFQQPAGRRAKFGSRNDLFEAEDHVAKGRARTFNQAAVMVAKKYTA